METAPAPPPDPNIAIQQERAQKTLVDNLQLQAAGDTAAIMSRYGSRLALANTGVAMPGAATSYAAGVAPPPPVKV